VAGAVAKFVISGTLAVLMLGIGGAIVLQRATDQEAIRSARLLTKLAATAIVQPELEAGARPQELGSLISSRILHAPVVRVKLWRADGTILYSDEPRLIGRRFRLGDDELRALRTGATQADVADLSSPENVYERHGPKLLEVYLRVRTRSGERMLFETYSRYSSVSASSAALLRRVAPVLVGALLLLELLQIPLAVSLARRLRERQRERERLLRYAVDASNDERRRIAGELHDGVVQRLAGTSFTLTGALRHARAGSVDDACSDIEAASVQARGCIRDLRTLIVEVYPPSLRATGLAGAVQDLVAPLREAGVGVQVEIPADLRLDAHVEEVLFRVAQEALRNVARHAAARSVRVRVRVNEGVARAEVADDGAGFDQAAGDVPTQGHVGLLLLADYVGAAGGELDVDSGVGRGTTVRAWLPLAGIRETVR
jgi:signal transduction histidine kinase